MEGSGAQRETPAAACRGDENLAISPPNRVPIQVLSRLVLMGSASLYPRTRDTSSPSPIVDAQRPLAPRTTDGSSLPAVSEER